MSVLYVSSRARFRLWKLLRISRRQDVTHFAYILETSDLKSQRHLSLRSSTDLLCSVRLQRSHRTTLSTEEEMLIAECLMLATTSTFAE